MSPDTAWVKRAAVWCLLLATVDQLYAQILANSVTATTGTAPIAAGIYHTPTSISGGGAGFVPLAGGTVNITATAPGYRAVTISTRTITVSN